MHLFQIFNAGLSVSLLIEYYEKSYFCDVTFCTYILRVTHEVGAVSLGGFYLDNSVLLVDVMHEITQSVK